MTSGDISELIQIIIFFNNFVIKIEEHEKRCRNKCPHPVAYATQASLKY